jgi:hypothetical protein
MKKYTPDGPLGVLFVKENDLPLDACPLVVIENVYFHFII